MTREELIGIAENDMRAIGKSLGMTPEAIENVIARSGIRATLVTVEEQREGRVDYKRVDELRQAERLRRQRERGPRKGQSFTTGHLDPLALAAENADDYKQREVEAMREAARTQVFDVSGFKTRAQAEAEKPADLGDDMIGEAFDLYAED